MTRFWIVIVLALFTSHARAEVLATVGAAKISTEDFNRRFDNVKKQAINPPTGEQFLEDLVRFEIGVQEAEKLKLQNDPVVKERFKQILYSALLEKKIGTQIAEIKITDNEMRTFYKKNPEVRLAHILVDLKEDIAAPEKEKARQRADSIWNDVKKSKVPFEDLVRQYSDDGPTKEAGGDIGFQSRVTLSPIIYEAAQKLKVGDVYGPIETRFGYHIIKVLERRDYDQADKHQIRAALFDDKRSKIFEAYFASAKKNYKVDINKDALKSVVQ